MHSSDCLTKIMQIYAWTSLECGGEDYTHFIRDDDVIIFNKIQ